METVTNMMTYPSSGEAADRRCGCLDGEAHLAWPNGEPGKLRAAAATPRSTNGPRFAPTPQETFRTTKE